MAAALSLLGSVWAHIHAAFWQQPPPPQPGAYVMLSIHPALYIRTYTLSHTSYTKSCTYPIPAEAPASGSGDEGLVHAIGLLRWLTLVARDCTAGA